MKNKWILIGTAGALLLTLIPIVLMLVGVIDVNAERSNQPVTKINEPTGIFIDGTERKGSDFYISVSNITQSFDFKERVRVAENAVWLLSRDCNGDDVIADKKSELDIGDNTFFIGVSNEEQVAVYSVVVRRRPLYNITFNSRGGSDVMSEQIEEGYTVIKPSDPTLNGYDFCSWHRDGLEYNFEAPVYSDINLIASWQPKKFTVTYTSEIGDMEIVCETVSYNSWFIPPEPKALESYEFFGWYINDRKIEEMVFDFEENITLTAKWLSKELVIENGIVLGLNEDYFDITEVKIPKENGIEEVYAISDRAFYYNHNIVKVILPHTITEIGEEAFYGCGKLEDISIVEECASLKQCGKNAFFKTKWLDLNQNDALYLGKCLVYVDKELTELEVKSGTLGLADNLFELSNIEKITLYEGLLHIGKHCFEDSAIKGIVLPSSVESIGEYAFYSASELAEATVFSPSYIGAYAFYGCDKLVLTVCCQPKEIWNPLWLPQCKVIFE